MSSAGSVSPAKTQEQKFVQNARNRSLLLSGQIGEEFATFAHRALCAAAIFFCAAELR